MSDKGKRTTKVTLSRASLEQLIEVTIRLSPIPLTAGGVHRIIEVSLGTAICSRSTVQRILDRMAAAGEVHISAQTIEKNGFLIDARVYSKA